MLQGHRAKYLLALQLDTTLGTWRVLPCIDFLNTNDISVLPAQNEALLVSCSWILLAKGSGFQGDFL